MIDQGKVSLICLGVDFFAGNGGSEKKFDVATIDGYIDQACRYVKAYTDAEREAARRIAYSKYQIHAEPGQSLLSDYDQEDWYTKRKDEIEENYWARYKRYLIEEKKFSPNVVSVLENDTLDQKLMNYILDPKEQYNRNECTLRRGLAVGDVQSGKTSTYIGFMCKAADAGYRVFILLAGTTESLRQQTQKRVEEGLIGKDSSDTKNVQSCPVGVGKYRGDLYATSLTSRKSDFTGKQDQMLLSLHATNGPVVFVIKKNKIVLEKLIRWLKAMNANSYQKIEFPMLLIDDEADNASINTSANKEDPTTINRLVRELANVFTVSNYVGFTATPYANIFIDPETTEQMVNQDLFPEDFIVTLPTPSNYIGPQDVFMRDGKHWGQVVDIKDIGIEEEDGYSFFMSHEKDWEGELPDSLSDAIYAFYIVNAIRDLRGDVKAHRTMMVNITRFVQVQRYVARRIEGIHTEAYSAIRFNIGYSTDILLKNRILRRIYEIWEEQYSKTEFTWDEIAGAMFKAIEDIQIKVVNSGKGSDKLEYPKEGSLRVIAVGGLALSRGLTLEGLAVSYFGRNTSTYDVLMQMGRWFGYRDSYEDLFRIWIPMKSATWYGEVARATELLKKDLADMRQLKLKPKDFGMRVRDISDELEITAQNKMRNTSNEYDDSNYFGKWIETPCLMHSAAAHKHNYCAVQEFVQRMSGFGISPKKQLSGTEKKERYIMCGVPKSEIISMIQKLRLPRLSKNFDRDQIVQFLEEIHDPSLDYFDVAFKEGSDKLKKGSDMGAARIMFEGISLCLVQRRTCEIDSAGDRLLLGTRRKLGSPDDGQIGICDYAGKSAQEIIDEAKEKFAEAYMRRRGEPFEGTNYASDTWFRYIKDRRPLLLIYFLDVSCEEAGNIQEKQFRELKKELNGIPVVGFGMGLPMNDRFADRLGAKYTVNRIYNPYENDMDNDIGEEE